MAEAVKDERVWDWSQAVEAFTASLTKLAEHIEDHQHFVGWELTALEIRQVIDGLNALDRTDTKEDEMKMDEVWDFIRDSYRRWWC